jgi:hypothetical protein
MRILILFAPKFIEWPLAICKELQRRDGSTTFLGLVSGEKYIFDYVSNNKNAIISPLQWLDPLEKKWLRTPYDPKRLEEYEKKLGLGIIKRIVIADRQIGRGFVSGAYVPITRLVRIAQDYDKIRRYVLGLLDHLFGIMEDERPDIVFCYGVAGSIAYAMSRIAPLFNASFKRLTNARVGQKFTLDESPEGLLWSCQKVFKKVLKDPSLVKDNLPEAREYITRYRSSPEVPNYVLTPRKKVKDFFSFKGFLKRIVKDCLRIPYSKIKKTDLPIRSVFPSEIFRQDFFNFIRGRKLMGNSLFCDLKDIPEGPFVYFPLHFEPEATTMVVSPMHTNQIAVIEYLAKNIPLSMSLVVKDHITMLGRRPFKFYKDIKKMPGVSLVSPYEDSIELIKRAALTCVITGTAAWEAILLKRPALIIGDSPFLALEKGIIHCPNLDNLAQAIANALTLPPVDDERLALFIAAVLGQSFDFPKDLYWGEVTSETVSDNNEILLNICDFLVKND